MKNIYKTFMVLVFIFMANCMAMADEVGILSVSGIGKTLFYVYDSEGDQLTFAATNQEIELPPGEYTVKLNKTIQTATIQAGAKVVLKAEP